MSETRKVNLTELIERAGGVAIVSRKAEVWPATVYGWMKAGVLGPRVGYSMTIRVAHILGVSPEELVGDPEVHA